MKNTQQIWCADYYFKICLSLTNFWEIDTDINPISRNIDRSENQQQFTPTFTSLMIIIEN